ncbi:hypothetical protein LJC07_05265 [Christensenellaceae bacterium OttesenSCG-928-L17]|nr:hypothetical protein [Christensenellaceae bacterium OttesenSCG-928-L17]
MPFCKQCGSYYTKSLGVCPRCNAGEKMEEYLQAQALDDAAREAESEPKSNMLRRRWVSLIIGVPALIAFLYLMAYIVKLLLA